MKSLIDNYYSEGVSVLENLEYEKDILANLVRRQASFQNYLIPWINHRKPLENCNIADIGCGTGSSTVAFANLSTNVCGYDIQEKSVNVARTRLDALGHTTIKVRTVAPEETLDRVIDDFGDTLDVISLIAVLEHMTPKERMDFLPRVWNMLKPGGILVVAELPNRLTYFDDHTSQLPFFHLLPDILKIDYACHSPRSGYAHSMSNLKTKGLSMEELSIVNSRWGVSLSYHDFETYFSCDNLEKILLADGYEHFAMKWWSVTLEEKMLCEYFLSKPVHKPLGFCRSVLNLIFVKPHPNSDEVALKHDADYIKKIFEYHEFPNEAINRMLSVCTV